MDGDSKQNPQAPREMTRREALVWLAQAGVAACAFSCGRLHAEDGERKKVGNLFEFPNGSAKEAGGAIVVRTDDGMAAFSRICTHKRHTLEIDENSGSIFCSLHGSGFDLSGKPTNGPATRALKWYHLEIDETGAVWLDTSKSVERGTWAPLPKWAQPKK